jgi:ATP-dependent helicase/nuclease subunit A
MREKFGGIEYKEEVWLYTGATYPELEMVEIEQTLTDLNQTELIIVDLKETEEVLSEEDSEVFELTNRELEARAIANRIHQLVKDPNFKVNDKEGLRKATYRDVVILLRTMSNWSETFIEQLSAAGIPCYSDTQSGYFQTLEIKTMLNFLRVLDNPQQDVPMTAVLYSPIANLSSTELAILKTEYGKGLVENKKVGMYEVARICASQEQGELSEKLKKFFLLYDELKEKIAYLSVHELIQEIYQKTGYDLFVFAMPAGQQRRNNLMMLVQHAIKFEQSSFHGLFQFIRYVERLLKYEIDYGEASSIGENDNAVRIMSIHKSKGLEFPVVFLGGMGKSFNNMDSREKILFHPDYGIGPESIDTTFRTKIPTLLKRTIARKLVLDNLAEELRVLYVALTRAKEKLIMVGTAKDAKKELDKFRQASLGSKEHLMFTTLMKANSYFAFVGPAVLDIDSVRISCIPITELEAIERDKQIEMEGKVEDLSKENFTSIQDPELKQQLLGILHFQYPYQQQAKLPIKTTVSELKKLGQQVDEELSAILREVQEELTTLILPEPTLPAFLKKEEAMKGSYRGTMIHKIMECMNFSATTTMKDITQIVEQLTSKGVFEQENITQISLKPIENFLHSSLCHRIRKAEQLGILYKEQQFVLGIPANEVKAEYQSEDVVLIQGIIDLYFEEEDYIVLVDYKTDRIGEGEEHVLLQRYQKQMDYYAMAIERLTTKPVKEKIIYSFALQKEIYLNPR